MFYQAREGASFDINGQPVFVNVGDIAEEGAPVLRTHGYLFEPVFVKFVNPHPQRADEPERAVPVNPRKPANQGARSR